MKCPICGSEYSLTQAEKDFLKHSVQLIEIERRLSLIRRKLEEIKGMKNDSPL
mgnify:CR=1 FL=1